MQLNTIKKVLNKCREEQLICICDFKFDTYRSYYIIDYNDKYIITQEETGLCLDGYSIIRIEDLSNVEPRNDLCSEINKKIGVTKKIQDPLIEITSWKTIFSAIKKKSYFVNLMDEYNDGFVMGKITKIEESYVVLSSFDSNGIWSRNDVMIPYDEITTICWKDHYLSTWQKYFKLINKEKKRDK